MYSTKVKSQKCPPLLLPCHMLCSLPSPTPAEFAAQRGTSNTSIFITEQNCTNWYDWYQILARISIFPFEMLSFRALTISPSPNYDLWSGFCVLGMVATSPGTVRNSSLVLCSCSGYSACVRLSWGQNQVSCQILIDPGWSPGHLAANFNTRIINVCHSFRRTCDQLNKVATKVCRTFVRCSRVLCRAGHEPSRSLKMYNHKEGLY